MNLTKRNESICELYASDVNLTLDEVGKEFDMTRQRVYQILKENGVETRPNPKYQKHGDAAVGNRSGTYNTWNSMITRCTCEKHNAYRNYGGRGIKVCDRWRNSYITFREDMGERPEGHQIDRIDNDGDYEPGNCRWVTRSENLSNRRGYGKSKHKGVTWHEDKQLWVARILVSGTKIHLGYFETEKQAGQTARGAYRIKKEMELYIKRNKVNMTVEELMND